LGEMLGKSSLFLFLDSHKLIQAISMKQAQLFGLKHSNRDFSLKSSWGKNQFNSSFPASLTAYLYSKGLDCKYLKLSNKLTIEHDFLNVATLFGIKPTSNDLFYAFESPYVPFQKFVVGNLPRVDLVTQSKKNGVCLAPIEIKLTALPDYTTCELKEEQYGSELVIRPDTIVYLACSIAQKLVITAFDLKTVFGEKYAPVIDWSEEKEVQPYLSDMIKDLNTICKILILNQKPMVLQPIWKTIGKSAVLAKNCLDVFVWSDLAFTRLFIDSSLTEIQKGKTKISRQIRTVIWLFKMLYDFAHKNQMNYKHIIDHLSYNTKNDKAFSLSGRITHAYMKSKELTKPRITQEDVKNIILGGGQNMLSPERRFDAIIYNTPSIFKRK